MMRRRFLSRKQVLLIMVGLLLSLDIARSLYARTGYADPVDTWQPDPSQYADLVWPPGSDLPPDTPRGARIFAQRCAVCHGPDGRGNGPAAPSLIPHPRDSSTTGIRSRQHCPRPEVVCDAGVRDLSRSGRTWRFAPQGRQWL